MLDNCKNNDLPNNWTKAKLVDVIELIMGQSPPSETYNTEGKGIPFFQGKAEFGDIYPKVLKYCTKPKKFAKSNDILLSVRAPVGATNLTKIDCCIGRGLASLRAKNDISNKFIFYYFRLIQNKLSEAGTGSTFKAINKSFLENLIIPISSLAEQHRIVAKIEELFSELDQGIESLKKAQEQLKIYRQAVLKYAFEGKLTEEWRTQQLKEGKLESAETLLEKIKLERENYYQQQLEDWKRSVKEWEANGKEGKNPSKPKKMEEVEPLTDAEIKELSKLPKEWFYLVLQDISIDITDGDHQAPPKSQEGIPFIVISNIKNNQIDFSNTKFVPLNYYHKLKYNRKPRKGDILYTVTGSFGIPCLINFEKKFCFQRHIGMIRLQNNISKSFIFYLLQSEIIMQQARKVATGTAQKTVPLSGLRSFKIPFPSYQEQVKIAEEIESRFSICDSLEATIEESLQKAEALRQSILKQAFEGKLVPQNPEDEPAEKLLERIKAEIAEVKM